MSSRLLKASHLEKALRGGYHEGKTGLHQNQTAFKKPADDKIPQKHELGAGGQSHERQGPGKDRRAEHGNQEGRKILL